MTTTTTTAQRYVAAVNEADEAALMALFAVDAVLRHPLGTYQGQEEIAGFYRGVVFAGQAQTEITRLVAGPDVEVAQIEATSPLGEPGNRAYAVDVFGVGPDGLIATLEIYYR
jgi:ketosteroid isomerase-like protein